MPDKKILPLALIRANDEEPVEGRTRLQKMIFLIQKQTEESIPIDEVYEYFPYDYGPFSKQLYEDLDELVEEGIIEERKETEEDEKKKYYYELTTKGRKLAKDELQDEKLEEKIEKIKSKYNKMNLPDLLDEIYSKHPDYAEKSVV